MQWTGVRDRITWLLDAAAKIYSHPCHSVEKEWHLKGCTEAMLAALKSPRGPLVQKAGAETGAGTEALSACGDGKHAVRADIRESRREQRAPWLARILEAGVDLP